MQFAGGMSIAELAAEWDRDEEWVESAVRRELLKLIPRRDGGLKATRAEMRLESSEALAAVREAQGTLGW